MSFWSALGKGVLNVATGGIGGTVLDAIGGVAGGAAKGSADQRVAEQPGRIGTYNANLAGTQLNDKRAMLASLLGGLEDAHISRPAGSTIPTFGITGGLRPSAISNKEALIRQLGTQVAPLDMPQAGLGEKVLGGVGLGANILGALGKIARPSAESYRTPPFVQQQAGVPSMPWTLGGGYS